MNRKFILILSICLFPNLMSSIYASEDKVGVDGKACPADKNSNVTRNQSVVVNSSDKSETKAVKTNTGELQEQRPQ